MSAAARKPGARRRIAAPPARRDTAARRSRRDIAAVPSRVLGVPPSTPSRRALLALMAALCWLVAAYAIMLLVADSMRPSLMQSRFDLHPVATSLHLGFGSLAITCAPLQLVRRLRRQSSGIHRWAGRAYAVAACVSGCAGLVLAGVSQGGVPAHVGFALLSVGWVVTTAVGIVRIRRDDLPGHRRWMSHSIALTFAAVTLRLYIPAGVLLGLPEERSYQVIAWLCWVPNVLVVEWAFRARRATADAGAASAWSTGAQLPEREERSAVVRRVEAVQR